ncbi:MAG: MgtC/SapB family protein [Streptosporangiales bacterium]|nr:MgtC/SapB family protein [Streptosporangiales bacterium]
MTWASGGWQEIGQGWWQILNIAVALVLSAAIGLERELRYRDAGLRTQTLVGVASALFTLVSKYGFSDILGDDVILDPSRVAAQIVSGIGFVGAGLIFVRRNVVRGLTTAATVWLTAAVGAAAGAGLPLLAVLVTASHFLVVYGLSPLARKLPDTRFSIRQLRVDYEVGTGVLARVLERCTALNFVVEDLGSRHLDGSSEAAPRHVSVLLQLRGKQPLSELASALDELDGVTRVVTGDRAEEEE